MSEPLCIIGAGIVGLTNAVAMAKLGYTVNLIDGKSVTPGKPSHPARVYALNQASQQLLIDLDVWPGDQAAPYQRMHVWDGKSQADIHFDCRDLGVNALGHIVAETDLKNRLIEQVRGLGNITLFENSLVDSIKDSPNQAKLTLAGGDSITSTLVMIADGPNSPMRQHLNIPMHQWAYQQTAFIATVKTDKPHEQCARQVFHPDGILAFLPLQAQNECAIVWSCRQDKADELKNKPESAWDEALTMAIEARLGSIHLTSEPQSYPLNLKHVKCYHGDHWIIMGDAAHSIHPMAGLGLNLGLADVSCWRQLLQNKTGTEYSKRILSQYQRQRKAAIWPVIALLQGLKALFNTEHKAYQFARQQGLTCFNQSPWLKRQIMLKAMTI